eukprot:6639518-Karenia_brevis.AAC.1
MSHQYVGKVVTALLPKATVASVEKAPYCEWSITALEDVLFQLVQSGSQSAPSSSKFDLSQAAARVHMRIQNAIGPNAVGPFQVDVISE